MLHAVGTSAVQFLILSPIRSSLLLLLILTGFRFPKAKSQTNPKAKLSPKAKPKSETRKAKVTKMLRTSWKLGQAQPSKPPNWPATFISRGTIDNFMQSTTAGSATQFTLGRLWHGVDRPVLRSIFLNTRLRYFPRWKKYSKNQRPDLSLGDH